MGEVAFRVKPDSDLYKNYFIAKEERQKFHTLARAFFQEQGFSMNGAYYQNEVLAMELTQEEREKYKSQLKKHRDENGLCVFKKVSAMQKEWEKSVCHHIDFAKLRCNRYWYFSLLDYSGHYALWDKEGELYGKLESPHSDFEKLPDYLERISLSQYYAIRDGE